MKIFHRYLILEFIGPYFLSLFVLAFILLMDRLFLLIDLLVRKGINIGIVLEIMLVSLPSVISYTAPLGTLIGSVMTMGRLSQDNEISAIKSSGISLTRIFSPLSIFALLIMLVMVFFNGFVWPESEHKARNLLMDVARKKPAVRISEGVFMDDFEGYTIYIGSMNERKSQIFNVAIFQKQKNLSPRLITAKQGKVNNSPDEKYLIFNLFNGEIHELEDEDKYRRLTFRDYQLQIPVDIEFVRRERTYRSTREMSLFTLVKNISKLSSEAKKLNRSMKTQIAKLKSASGSQSSDPAHLRIEEEKTKVRYKKIEANRYWIEVHKKFSLAFSCFFFLFFGAPLGVVLKKGGIGLAFIVGLVFFAVYYILLIAGENLADSQKISPFLGMWFSNLILLPVIIELYLRTHYEKSLLTYLQRKVKLRIEFI